MTINPLLKHLHFIWYVVKLWIILKPFLADSSDTVPAGKGGWVLTASLMPGRSNARKK
jgi:hypothetical protein